METQWRATGPYTAGSALFSGILDETRLFLVVFSEQQGDFHDRVTSTKQELLSGVLPQRSVASRKSIISRISRRLTYWNPPEWVLNDLAAYAKLDSSSAIQAALLVHVCRQDQLLYNLVQLLVSPMWQEGRVQIDRNDVQRFLDTQVATHPEIETWTRQTRYRLGTTTLSILRDYGLLTGKRDKIIVEPIVPEEVVDHVHRLLKTEGLTESKIVAHTDWRLWLWSEERTRIALANINN